MTDIAETLLSELSLVKIGEAPSRFGEQVRASLEAVYGNYSDAIQGWTNLLANPEAFRPPVRRSIISAYLARNGRDWTKLSNRELERISPLAKENLEEEPDSDPNLRMWFRVVRATGELPIGRITQQLTYKSLTRPTPDTLFYLYILKFLQTDMGVREASVEASSVLETCRELSTRLPNRTRSFEWLGHGTGLKALVNQSSLGDWDSNSEFWSNVGLLRQVEGRISRIRGPAAGEIELPSGLNAFFVPARGQIAGGYLAGRDIGHPVQFYLGFSYDGLRAWNVGNVEIK